MALPGVGPGSVRWPAGGVDLVGVDLVGVDLVGVDLVAHLVARAHKKAPGTGARGSGTGQRCPGPMLQHGRNPNRAPPFKGDGSGTGGQV